MAYHSMKLKNDVKFGGKLYRTTGCKLYALVGKSNYWNVQYPRNDQAHTAKCNQTLFDKLQMVGYKDSRSA